MPGLVALLHRIGPYGLASALQAGSSFVVLPLLILLLGATSYAKFALLEPLLTVLAQALLLGGHQGLIHAVCKEDWPLREALTSLVVGSQVFLIPMLAAVSALVWFWQDSVLIAGALGIALYFEAINLLFLTAARAIGASWSYFTAVCLRVMVMLGGVTLTLYVAGRQGASVEFVIALSAAAALLSMVGLVITLRKQLKPSTAGQSKVVSTTKFTQDAVIYGLPIVLAGLCQSVISFGDRYVLSLSATPQTVAGYVVAVKLANALNFVSTPINLWWPTARFGHQKDADGGLAFFRNAAVSIGGLYSLAALGLIGISPFLLPLLGPGIPVLSAVAGLLVVASYFSCMQVILNVGLLSAGHTKKNFLAAGTVAVLNTLACFAVVPFYGALGAATVSACGALLLLVLLHILSQQVIMVPQRYGLLSLEALMVCLLAITLDIGNR